MAWPPPTLATSRTNTTVMTTTHPADHNAANLAINDIVARFPRTYHTAMSTGPRTDNGPVVDLGTYLAAASVTGWAFITVTGEVHAAAATNFNLMFITPTAPAFGYSSARPQSRQSVPMNGNLTASSWTPYMSFTLAAPCTAGAKPAFTVQVYIGAPGTTWYLAAGMNVLEVAT